MNIDYLVIGHICADLQPDGSRRLGGTAVFAALTAYQLGLRVAVVTACGPDLDLSELPAEIMIERQPSAATTLFENRYLPGGRIQLVHARSVAIDLAAIPPAWLSAPIVHFAPIMPDGPVPQETVGRFEAALVGATPQGWLRHLRPDRTVETTPATLLELPLEGVQVVIFSEEDVQNDEALALALSTRVPLVVLTRAERGATLLTQGTAVDIPALPAEVVDPTGAGDVFAAAFLSALQQGQPPEAAARWACATAAFAIEAPGATGLPTAEMVRQRLAR